MSSFKLSVSIVVYNESFSNIKDCLETLVHSIPDKVRYIVTIVDNGVLELKKDSDISINCLRYFPHSPIRYIVSPKNGGYGYGHNQAIFYSTADYHLIINGDIKIMPNALKNALNFMDRNSAIGMLVPDVCDIAENRIYLCRQNPSLWISFLRRFAPIWLKNLFKTRLASFEMRDKNYDKPIFNLTNPTGCFMLCRLSVLKAIQGFDENFFMYYEDADLGRRMAKLSQIAYVPFVKIKHEWKRAAYYNKRMAWNAIKSAFYYAWKWQSKKLLLCMKHAQYKEVDRSTARWEA